MAINSQTLSSIQNKVTGLTTNETDFRSGLNDTLQQVSDSEELLSNVSASDLVKLSEVSATATEINKLSGVTASTTEINKLYGLTATTTVLNTLGGYTGTTLELNKLHGLTASTAELNKLKGFTGSYTDLNKIAGVTATAAQLNVLSGWAGTTADLDRAIWLDDAGDGTTGQVLTYDETLHDATGGYKWTSPGSFTWTLEDEDGSDVAVDTDRIKITSNGGIDIDFGTGDGSDENPVLLYIDNTDKGSSQFIFKTISVSGQTDVVANDNADVLTLVAGSGMTITTDATAESITFSSQAYDAGAGLDITNGILSVETDLRDSIEYVGKDNSNYLHWDTAAPELGAYPFLSVTVDGEADTTFTSAGIQTQHLQTSGYIQCGSYLTVTGAGSFGGDVSIGGSLTETSDKRIKTNITPISNAIEKVQKLNGYTYQKIDGGPREYTGVIAQEVLEVLPEAVFEIEEGKYTVAYGNMVGLLIEAIKDLKAEIEELKK